MWRIQIIADLDSLTEEIKVQVVGQDLGHPHRHTEQSTLMHQLKQQEEQVPEEDGSEAMLNKAITAPVQ